MEQPPITDRIWGKYPNAIENLRLNQFEIRYRLRQFYG